MSLSTSSRRRWTESTIESQLRVQLAELGHFPTRAELVARGLRGLWDALRSAGGVEVWQARLEGAGNAEARTPQAVPGLDDQPSQDGAANLDDVSSGNEASSGNDASSHSETPGTSRTVSHGEIEVRAFELYERGATGDAVTHWLDAEQELASTPSGP